MTKVNFCHILIINKATKRHLAILNVRNVMDTVVCYHFKIVWCYNKTLVHNYVRLRKVSLVGRAQGKTSKAYVLKPELPRENVEKYEKSKKRTSRSPNNAPQEVLDVKLPSIALNI